MENDDRLTARMPRHLRLPVVRAVTFTKGLFHGDFAYTYPFERGRSKADVSLIVIQYIIDVDISLWYHCKFLDGSVSTSRHR
jgi:hypothetical protein